tara:strand:+ start:1166 stop:1663 length:498 start_codon:yes stop_codon:yes gene_type:complete
MLNSNIKGYNNNSGLLYRCYNGLAQYKVEPMYPSWSAPQAKYRNEKNEEELLDTMNDGEEFFNKGGQEEIGTIMNKNLQDGGFKNKGNVEEQTTKKQNFRLKIPKKAKILAERNVGGLPTVPSQPPKGASEEMKKFDSFLSTMEGKTKKFKNATTYKKPRARSQY